MDSSRQVAKPFRRDGIATMQSSVTYLHGIQYFFSAACAGGHFFSERYGSGSDFVAGETCFQRTQRLSNEARRGEAGPRL
jgi:hypothetical protein